MKQARNGAGVARSLSSAGAKPSPSGTAVLNKAKNTAADAEPALSSSGSGGLLLFAGVIGAIAAASLQMEIDADFRASSEAFIPSALSPLFDSTRSLLRSVGLVDMVGTKGAAPVAAVPVAAVPVAATPTPKVEVAEVAPSQVNENPKFDAADTSTAAVEVNVTDGLTPVAGSSEEVLDFMVSEPTELADENNSSDDLHNQVVLVQGTVTEEKPLEESTAPAAAVQAPLAPRPSHIEMPHVALPSAAAAVETQYKEESSQFQLEMERHYLSGVEALDADELRQRMRTLVADYAQRSKWEAVRLHQSVKHVEKEVADHYISAIARQQAELELKVERDLAKRETDVRIEMSHIINDLREAQEFRIQDALKSQERSLQTAFDKEKEVLEEKVRKEAEQDHHADLARFKMEQMNKLLQLHKSLEDANGHIAFFDRMAEQIIEGKRHSARVHEASAALLALEIAMSTSRPVENEVTAVKKVCDPNSVIAVLLDTIPTAVCKNGVPTVTELRARFSVAKEEARKAALAPNNAPKMVGQMIGSTLAALLWEVEGNVPGESEEAVLARTSYFLDHGNLRPAFEQLSGLRGYPKTLLKDWEVSARERLVADQTIECMKAAAAIEHLERKI